MLYVLDKEGATHQESSNVVVDEHASLSPLSEFTITPSYSPVSGVEEGDAGSVPVEVDCEVQTSGTGVEKSLYQPLAHGAVYFGRIPGMARTTVWQTKWERPSGTDHHQPPFLLLSNNHGR